VTYRRNNWKEKRTADKKALAELRDAEPEDWEETRAAGIAIDEEVRAHLRALIAEMPDSPHVPCWRGALERGHITHADAMETAALIERQILANQFGATASDECEKTPSEVPAVAQRELF